MGNYTAETTVSGTHEAVHPGTVQKNPAGAKNWAVRQLHLSSKVGARNEALQGESPGRAGGISARRGADRRHATAPRRREKTKYRRGRRTSTGS